MKHVSVSSQRERKQSETFSNSHTKRDFSKKKSARVKAERSALGYTQRRRKALLLRVFLSRRARERDGARTSRWKREALKSFLNATTRKNRRPPFRFLKKPLSGSSGAVEERDGDDAVFGVRVGVSSVVFFSPEELQRE
jgi:hypothetical protein